MLKDEWCDYVMSDITIWLEKWDKFCFNIYRRADKKDNQKQGEVVPRFSDYQGVYLEARRPRIGQTQAKVLSTKVGRTYGYSNGRFRF